MCVRYDSKASASESSADGGDSDEDRKKKPAKKAKFVKERKPRKKEVRKESEWYNLWVTIRVSINCLPSIYCKYKQYKYLQIQCYIVCSCV